MFERPDPIESVKSFWDDRAGDPSLDQAQVTHPDIWQRWLEIGAVKPFLRSSDHAIDVGCGSGYATKVFAPLVSSIKGVDFSEGMIERAKRDGSVAANATFQVGNVLELSPSTSGIFDVALTLRCLINLPDWEAQKAAIANIASVVKPHGRYIFVEGSKEGRAGLNRARVDVGLEAMPPVWHNVDFERERTIAFLEQYYAIVEELGFGLYDLIARIVHPLLVAPDKPQYEAGINEVAARVANKMQACNNLSRVLFLVLERKR
jgi:SAM-dependent methyltransferase